MRWKTILRGLVVAAVTLVFLGCLLAILITGPVVVRVQRTEPNVDPSPARLRADVSRLCEEFNPRGYRQTGNLDRAAEWIAGEFERAGLQVEFQDYVLPEGRYRNVVAVRQGREASDSVLVIGAHYDAYGDLPGADDNASGVAVLLELARTLPRAAPRRTQYLVAFSTEEPPFFGTEAMGSFRFARSLREKGLRVELMVALDLVGRFSDEPGSQRFPLPGLGLLYPDRGNFIAVVGDLASGSAIKRVRSAMQATQALPVHSLRGPAALQGVRWSDHDSFRRLNMPAVLVTDTAYLRNLDYHTAEDTPDKLDYERMSRLVVALHGVLQGPG